MLTSAVVKNSWVLISGSPPTIGAQYAITIPYWNKADLVVQVVDAGGTKVTLVLGTDYTLSDPSESGGILTVQSNWTYSPNDWITLSVYRMQSTVQSVNFRNGDTFDMPTLEYLLDRIVGMIQETNAGTSTGSGGSYYPTGQAAVVLQGLATSLLAGQIAFGLLPAGTPSPLSVAWQQTLAAALGANWQTTLGQPLGAGWGGASGPLEAALGSGWASAFASVFNTAVCPPIGFVYIQGAGDAAPGSLWPATTWTNVSSEEAGAFRRMTGGTSPNIGPAQGVSQTDMMQGHVHFMNVVGSSSSGGGTGNIFAGQANIGNVNTGVPLSDGTNGTPRTGIENRPYNYGVTKWRRTA